MKDSIDRKPLPMMLGWTNYDDPNNPKWEDEMWPHDCEIIGVDSKTNIYFAFVTWGDIYTIYLVKISISGKVLGWKKLLFTHDYDLSYLSGWLLDYFSMDTKGNIYWLYPMRGKIRLVLIKEKK